MKCQISPVDMPIFLKNIFVLLGLVVFSAFLSAGKLSANSSLLKDTNHIEVKCEYKGKKVKFHDGFTLEFYIDNKLVPVICDSTGFFLPDTLGRKKVTVCFKYKNKQYRFSPVYHRFLKGIWNLCITKSFFNGGGFYKFYIELIVPDDESYVFTKYRNKMCYYLYRINKKIKNQL